MSQKIRDTVLFTQKGITSKKKKNRGACCIKFQNTVSHLKQVSKPDNKRHSARLRKQFRPVLCFEQAKKEKNWMELHNLPLKSTVVSCVATVCGLLLSSRTSVYSKPATGHIIFKSHTFNPISSIILYSSKSGSQSALC